MKKMKQVAIHQGRHGRCKQGYGYDPEVIRSSNISDGTLDSMGLTGPTAAPVIEVSPTSTIPDPDTDDDSTITVPMAITYYVARLDIEDSGSRYTEPPLISIDGHTPDQDASKSEDTTSPLPPRKTPIPAALKKRQRFAD